MPERPDFIPHTVARELVRIASQGDDLGAESHLIEYMSKLPPDGWRSRLWGAQVAAAAEDVRVDRWLVAESARAMQVRLWKEAHTPRDGALIHVRGNEAIYRGPLLWLPVWVEVSSPKGVIIPRYSPLVVPDSLTVIDPRWQAEVHLGAIGLRAGPLVEALRRDFGGLADRAVKQLQERGLLPAAFSPARHWIEAALVSHPPLIDETKKHWAERAAPEQARHVQNWLSKNDDAWRKHGGGAVPPRQKS
jgi:hypothetical protein